MVRPCTEKGKYYSPLEVVVEVGCLFFIGNAHASDAKLPCISHIDLSNLLKPCERVVPWLSQSCELSRIQICPTLPCIIMGSCGHVSLQATYMDDAPILRRNRQSSQQSTSTTTSGPSNDTKLLRSTCQTPLHFLYRLLARTQPCPPSKCWHPEGRSRDHLKKASYDLNRTTSQC